MKTDVAIVGGGPGGATTAMFLARRGIGSVIIDREEHPRFHIGESLTGEAGNVLRALDLEDEMLGRHHPVKYGVTVYGKGGKNAFWVPVKKRTAAGLEDTFTWSVRRSDYDQMLLDGALGHGTRFVQGRAVAPIMDGDRARGVRIVTDAGEEDIEADVLVDASGQATFLATYGLTGPRDRGNYDRQVALFSHFTGSVRDGGTVGQDAAGNTLIFYQDKNHWAWAIPLDDEVTSIGVVVPSNYYRETGEDKETFLLREMRELNEELAARTEHVTMVEPVRAHSNYSYHVRGFTGPGWLCVGDSHRFVDPIFSFGVHVAMAEARMASEAIESYLAGGQVEAGNPFAEYERMSERGIDVVQDLIDTFWDHSLAFSFFIHQRYTDQMIDMFAGRLYDEEPSDALKGMRKLLGRSVGVSELARA